MTTTPGPAAPSPLVVLADPDLVVVRVGRWHLEVERVGAIVTARWWAPGGASVEVLTPMA